MLHRKDLLRLNLAIAVASSLLVIGFWSLKNLTQSNKGISTN
jgi:branched-chain amino acid transport system substrate-binding protein